MLSREGKPPLVGCFLLIALAAGVSSAADETAVLPETMTEDNVMAFIEDQDITTVAGFIEALPPLHKSFYIAVHSSSSPAADFVSPTHPRIVSWGATGRFIVTWTTDRADPDSDKVEFLQPMPDEARWIAGVLDFSASPPQLRHPGSCSRCHSDLNRPLWGVDSVHEGTENDGLVTEQNDARTVHLTMKDTTDPRLTPLNRSGYSEFNHRLISRTATDVAEPNWELARAVALRHSEVLFQHLRQRSSYDIESLICGFGSRPSDMRRNVGAQYRKAQIDLSVLADTRQPIQGHNPRLERNPKEYHGGGTSIQAAIAFQIFHDAWQQSAVVRAAYAATSNARMLARYVSEDSRRNLLRFPPGAATAETEFLLAYRELFELEGQGYLDAVQERQVDSLYHGTFAQFHVDAFLSCVCSSWQGSVPDDCGEAVRPPPPPPPIPGGEPPGDPPPPDPEPEPEPEPQPPVAAFTLDADCQDDLCRTTTGTPVTFKDTSTGSVRFRTWDFADEQTSRAAQQLRHTWTTPGFYTVTLTVSDGTEPSTASRTVLVEAAEPAGSCEYREDTLCLQNSRYAVRIDWHTDEVSGTGSVVQAGTNDSGLFRFFDGNNWEVLIKVLDGCSLNGHVWVFGASTTDLGYTLVVTDTVTGTVREYTNEAGTPAHSIADGAAFPEGCDS